MKTDTDTCLRDLANWFAKNRREITVWELVEILRPHCEDTEELVKVREYLLTEDGKAKYRIMLREALTAAEKAEGGQ